MGWINKGQCEEDPTKQCPYRFEISGPGVIHVDSETIFKCCKGQRQLEALRKIHEHRVRKQKCLDGKAEKH